jgi:DNA-binding LacI/PurR family transcriptional regulator
MTVSNAFSRPDQLSAALRGRILAAAEELGYAGPDPAARALARGTTGSVGVMLTDSLTFAFTDEVATGFLGAITAELAPTGFALTLLSSSATGEVVPARDVPMDGALVYSCDSDSAAVDWLNRRGLPIVYVDQAPVPGASSVNVDDRGGARAAAEHLVELGHRRVAILTSEKAGPHGVEVAPDLVSYHNVARQRMLGWLDALQPAGVEPRVIRVPLKNEDAAYDAAKVLLDRADAPTALLCFSDVLAHGAVRAAADLGVRIPEQLSVVGFDDSPLSQRMRPALTTVRQDVAGKGRAAAAALIAAIESAQSGEAAKPRRVLLPTELVVRESTGPAPS